MADDSLATVTDWLGREQPLARKSLDLTTSGGGGVTAPVTPSVAERAQAVQSILGGVPPTPAGATAQQILAGLKTGTSAANQISRLFPQAGVTIDPTIRAAAAAEAAPQAGGAGTATPIEELARSPAFPIPTDVLTGTGGGSVAPATTGPTAATTGDSALGTVAGALPYLGAALTFAQDLMGNTPDEQKAINAALDVAAAALIPATAGLSEVALPLAKAEVARTLPDIESGNAARLALLDLNPALIPFTLGADIISMFGGPDITAGIFSSGPSRFIKAREGAGKEARADLSGLGASYQAAASSGDLGQVLTALQTPQGQRGAVRSALTLPPEVAQSLGLPAGTVEWSSVTPAQFTQILDYFRQDPTRIRAGIGGSGDVGYLNTRQATEVGDAAALDARALIEFVLSQSAQASPTTTPTSAPAMPAPTVVPRGPSGALGFAQDLLATP